MCNFIKVILVSIIFFSCNNNNKLYPVDKPTTPLIDTIQQISSNATDTMKRPFQIKMTNVEEVRMGSPFMNCDIEIVGFDKIKLPRNGWQNKYAWSNDSQKLVLIKWDFDNNEPSFHLFLIDILTGETKKSPKLFGLPNNIKFSKNKVKINKFVFDKEKSVIGNLCCDIDEVFDFSE